MLTISALGTRVADSKKNASTRSFCKDTRKFSVGDCALFKAPEDRSPPFIGIIRCLTYNKEDYLKLGVNWLYRPADVKLNKGVLLVAAPNELFYSFHTDEIPAASLLHLCKVAFLRKGVDFPPGISSFVCRRVYDTRNKCLWWLTDQDYVNERQEEVDLLLDKTQLEMHAGVQSGGRSPKLLNGPTSAQQSKLGSDSAQNNTSSFPSQVKGKKRERTDQASDPVKRERLVKTEDGDVGNFKSESMLKKEIAKITERGGLVDIEGVEKLVHLMQPDKSERKIDLAGRIMLAEVISATNGFECLGQFVQQRGLAILDEWLQEVHKGKIGDSSSKENDKSVEAFLFALLRALDKLPVNLHALQTCNVGRSVNNLRTHKNLEIQKKARSLVDTWKKRVQAEMNSNDAKPGLNQSASSPTKPSPPEVSHGGSRLASLSSDVPVKGSTAQSSPKSSHLNRKCTSEKVLQSGLTCERTVDAPVGDHGNNHRLIVRLPNPARSPARSDNGGLFDDAVVDRASSPSVFDKNDQYDRKVKGSGDSSRPNVAADVNAGSRHNNDVKSGFAGSDEGVRSPALVLGKERCRSGDEIVKSTETSKLSSQNDKGTVISEYKSVKSYNVSNRSIDALIESVKFSEAGTSVPAGDDVGMNLLATVAAVASPIGSPPRNLVPEVSSIANNTTSRVSCEDVSLKSESQSDIGGDIEKQVIVDGHLRVNDSLHQVASVSSDSKTTNCFREEKATGVRSEQLGSSCSNLQGNAGRYTKSDGNVDERTSAPSVVASSADTRDIEVGGAAEEQMGGKRTTDDNLDNDVVEDIKNTVKSPMLDESKAERAVEKTSATKRRSTSDALHGATGDRWDNDKTVSTLKVKKDAVGGLKSGPQLKMNDEKKMHVDGHLSGTSLDACATKSIKTEGRCCDSGKSPADSSSLPNLDSAAEANCEKNEAVDVRSNGSQKDDERSKLLTNVAQGLNHRVEPHADSVLSCQNNGDAKDSSSERKETLQHLSGGTARGANSPVVPPKESLNCMKSLRSEKGGLQEDETDECASTTEVSSLSVAAGSDVGTKLDFDLNEGFTVDEGNQDELVTSVEPSSTIQLRSALSVSPMPNSLPASITVAAAAAAKGHFVPPENLLKSKGEVGWKGSAATSAFRPAEPRKVLEMPLSTDIPPRTSASKQNRPPLDIDLNVADERVLGDTGSRSSAQELSSEYGHIIYHALGRNEMLASSSTPVRTFGGLGLDLNRMDEGFDTGQSSVSTIRGMEVPLMSAGPSSIGFPNEVNGYRDFDLNNGPVVDEAGSEPMLRMRHTNNSIPFLSAPAIAPRLNNTELGSLSSWFPTGSSYPAVAIPSILPDKGDQPFPYVAAAGMQRTLGPHTGGTAFCNDAYRGPVLSSSPAITLFPNTPFPYPGFPFGTNSSLPSTSFSAGSTTYVDSSPGASLYFPAVPSQMLGPAGAFSSQYPRPYMMSHNTEGSSNGGADSSRKFGRQGLDLNAGPGGLETESRDERLSSGSRQLPVPSPHVVTEEQARMFQAMGRIVKRKEPEGGWDPERFSYK